MISGSDAGAHLPRHARWWPQRPIAGLCRGSSSTPDIDHCVGMMLGLPCAFRSFPAATHLGILLYVFRLTRMCSKNTPVRAVYPWRDTSRRMGIGLLDSAGARQVQLFRQLQLYPPLAYRSVPLAGQWTTLQTRRGASFTSSF